MGFFMFLRYAPSLVTVVNFPLTELVTKTHLTVPDICHDVANTHTTVSDLHHDIPHADNIVPSVRRDVSNAHVSEVRSNITNTRTVVSDIHCDTLKSRKDTGGQNRAVSVAYTDRH